LGFNSPIFIHHHPIWFFSFIFLTTQPVAHLEQKEGGEDRDSINNGQIFKSTLFAWFGEFYEHFDGKTSFMGGSTLVIHAS